MNLLIIDDAELTPEAKQKPLADLSCHDLNPFYQKGSQYDAILVVRGREGALLKNRWGQPGVITYQQYVQILTGKLI